MSFGTFGSLGLTPDSQIMFSGLLFDIASMPADLLRQASAQALTWVDTLGGLDRVALVSVDTPVNVIADFTADRDALIAALQSLEAGREAPGAATASRVEPGSLAASPAGALFDAGAR